VPLWPLVAIEHLLSVATCAMICHRNVTRA
jgi:hypothetical protein